VKFKGLELFGTYELAQGNTSVENGEIQYSVDRFDGNGDRIVFQELDDRESTQTAVDLLYRFGKRENFYVGARYNLVDSQVALGTATTQANISQGTRVDVTIDRTAIAAGWFITRSVLLKAEYVVQNYDGYPDDSMLHKGKFDGWLVQGVIGF
jgi:hypothetical protein